MQLGVSRRRFGAIGEAGQQAVRICSNAGVGAPAQTEEPTKASWESLHFSAVEDRLRRALRGPREIE